MSADPLKLSSGHTGPLITTVEIPASYAPALAELRLKAGLRDTLTARFLGMLVVQAISEAGGELVNLPPILGETPLYWRLRNALGVLTAEGKGAVARTDLALASGISAPMVTLFTKWAVKAGLVEEEFGSSSTGRPAKVVKLTTLGMRHGEKDHPDDSVRFALGGMLPEIVIEKEIAKYQQPMALSQVTAHERELLKAEDVERSEPEPYRAPPLATFWKQALERAYKGPDSEDD